MTTSLSDLSGALMAVRQAREQINIGSQSIGLRSDALKAMGGAIAQHQDDILEANTLDLEISRDMAVPEIVVDWLKLTPERVQTVADVFLRLASAGAAPLPSAAGGASGAFYQLCPVGTVGFIYEAFPDLGAIAAALCICTGNALVLKGGSEASRTNKMITDILQDTLEKIGLPATLIYSIESTEVSRLDLAQCTALDLIIPHGRPSLVAQVVAHASAPVIPSRMGNCYLYWSASGSLEQVYQMIVDSHSGTPDAVNRIEKVLLHESHSSNAIIRLWNRLQEQRFEIKADEDISRRCQQGHRLTDGANAQVDIATPADWQSAYLTKKVAFRQVKDTGAAIEWINRHSSGHADSIATADYLESRQFACHCTSAAVYVNTSPGFVRNAKQVSDIALGASDYKGASGGLIGMQAMQTQQRIFQR